MHTYIPVCNPATGETVGEIENLSPEKIGAVIDTAQSTLNKWQKTAASARAVIFVKAAQKMRAEADRLAQILTREQGKPLREAKDEIRGAAHVFEYYASVCGAITGDAKNLPGYGYLNVVRKPLGICAGIIPWNMPAIIFAWKSGAALACGNASLIKPSKTAPLTILELIKILHESGVPEGVLAPLTGEAGLISSALLKDERVRKISFTGSIETGIALSRDAAPYLKKLTLELGGNDPFIVTETADLKKAVNAAVHQRFYNCGQVCTSCKRIIVHESLADAFTAAAAEKIAALRVGPGIENTDMGPLNNAAQLDFVEQKVNHIRDRNLGEIVIGGERRPGLGNFYLPTLIKDVSPEAVSDEIFGPVMPVISYADDDEAISLANSTWYGLGASIWTGDIARARKFADELKAGVVWINKHLILPPEMPFGGTGWSGYGKENGTDFINEYTESKSILLG